VALRPRLSTGLPFSLRTAQSRWCADQSLADAPVSASCDLPRVVRTASHLALTVIKFSERRRPARRAAAQALAIDLEDGREILLRPWQCVTIPAGVRHRTRAVGRTANLCFEKLGAEMVFVD
jgi:hypothetical protein